MNHTIRQRFPNTGWTLVRQAIGVLAVLMLVLSPLAGHAYAGQDHMCVSISAEVPDADLGDGATGSAQFCRVAVGCAGIALTTPFALSEPVAMSLAFRRIGTELWQGRQAEPKLRPPIL